MAITDGLLHCWNFEETSGTRMDAVGTLHLGEAGTPTPSITGKVALGVEFSGTNWLVGGDLPPRFNPPFTIAFWMWIDAYPTGASWCLVGQGYTLSAGNYYFYCIVRSDDHLVQMSVGSSARGLVSSVAPVPLGGWHLVVAWASSVTPGDAGTTNIQIDNGPIATTGNGLGVNVFGVPTVGAIGSGSEAYLGRLDQLMYWGRALTDQAERDIVWNGGAGQNCAFQPIVPPLPPCPEPPWLAQFHDALLDQYISYGCKLKLKFQTFIVRMRQGHEERIGEWQDPLWTFDITPALRDQADLDYLIAFFRARNGPEFIFKFLNPLDFQVQNQLFGVGDGVTTEFQLSRRYATGIPGDGLYYVRPIVLPALGTLVYDNGAVVAEGLYVVCPLGGTIVFVTPPGPGHVLTWSGMYYTPVRFLTNRIYSVVEHYEHFEDQIMLIEERLGATAPVSPEEESPDFVDVCFPALYAQRATMGPDMDVVTITSDSGGTSRTLQFKEAKIRFTVEETEQSQAVMQTLLAFFYNRKGRLYGFRARDITDFQLLSEPTQQSADGVRTTFQLVKRYPSGAQTDVRTITKPCSDLVISVGGVPATPPPSINFSTGIVTFASPPAAGAVITCTGTFDVPVRFDSDEVVFSIQGFESYNLEAIGLLETELGLPQFTIDALLTT